MNNYWGFYCEEKEIPSRHLLIANSEQEARELLILELDEHEKLRVRSGNAWLELNLITNPA